MQQERRSFINGLFPFARIVIDVAHEGVMEGQQNERRIEQLILSMVGLESDDVHLDMNRKIITI